MRSLNRNKRTIYYALYQGKTPKLDSEGFDTGRLVESYSTPTALRINKGSDRGYVGLETIGLKADYDRTLVTSDMNCPISEDSILWIEKSITEKHDYRVNGISKTLNNIIIYAKKV